MANKDKFWFDFGIREDVSKKLTEIMLQAENLKDVLEGMTVGQNAIRNAAELERALDKIALAKERLSESKSLVTDKKDEAELKKMEKSLNKIKKSLEEFAKMGSGLDLAKMGSKGFAKYLEEFHNLALALDQVKRKTGEINAQAKEDERNKEIEAKRLDDLKSKYYELYDVRQKLQDAMLSAAPGKDITGAMKMSGNLTSRIIDVTNAIKNGDAMPSSVFGADYDEYMRKVKDETRELTAYTDNYNKTLSTTEGIQENLQRIMLDTESQKTIANIRKQTNEYVALGNKLAAIKDLMQRVEDERQGLQNGTIKTQVYTPKAVNAELEAIQRRYNEELARGKQMEKESAEAKAQMASASKRAADAIQLIAHANQGLMSSYNRVAEAGTNANRVTIQLQNQIGQYASLYGLERLLKTVVTVGGQFEYQHIALQNILGDIQEANNLFGQLQELAIESPKTFMELTAYSKQLSAYQIPAGELFDTTRRLADLSAGLGVDMSRLILAYGQVRSAAVLRGQELRQFTEAGIPMVQALADKFTELNGKLVTTADVFKLISQRAVPFEMVRDVLWDMTNQGGQFYNMQAELADTLYGKWQKLQDQWQITLGHIADGNGLAGSFFKTTIEGLVKVASLLDTLLPALGMFAAGFGLSKVITGAKSYVDDAYGNTAIRNMEIAKLKEANRLERERVMYGKQLTAQEMALVQTKNKLVSRDYVLLAQAGELSRQKAMQLIKDGQINRMTLMRLALEHGITKEKIRQMTVEEVASVTGVLGGNGKNGVLGKMKGGILGFFGGPVGLGITATTTALGLLGSYMESVKQKEEELAQKGDMMMTHAQQNFNSIEKTLSGLSMETSMEKKVNSLEEALLQLGSTGEAVVAKSREHMDDINKRWEILKKGAEAYKEVVGTLSSPEGKALYEAALKDSNIEEFINKYDNAQGDVFKYQATLQKFDETYKKVIENIAKNNKDLKKQLEGKSLFEQLGIVGINNIRKELTYANANKYGGQIFAPYEAAEKYFSMLKNVENKWDDITEKSIPQMADKLKALARKEGINDFTKLSDNQKQKLEAMSKEVVNAFGTGTKEVKDKIAQELANQVFHIKIEGDVTVNKTKLSSFADWVWGKFGGYTKKSNKIKIGDTDYTKEQVASVFDNIDDYAKRRNQELDELEKTEKRLREAGATSLADETKKQAEAIDKELTLLRLREQKTGGGNKTDAQLKQWREELKELQEFWREYESLVKRMDSSSAINEIRKSGVLPGMFDGDKLKVNVREGLGKALDDLLAKTSATTAERKTLQIEIKKARFNVSQKEAQEAADAVLKQLDDELKKQGKQWDLYRKILDATGNKQQAGQIAFGGGVRFDNYAEELRSRIEKELENLPDARNVGIDKLLGMDSEALERVGIFEKSRLVPMLKELKSVEQQLKSEEVDIFLKALENAKSLDSELDQIRLKYEKTRNSIVANVSDPTQRQKMLDDADKNQKKDVADKTWEYFKRNEEWGRVFSNLDRMSTQTLRGMLDKLTDVAPKINESVEATKALYEAMEKLQEQLNSRSPFAAIITSIGQMSRLRQLYNTLNGGTITPTAASAKYYGLQEGKKYTSAEIKDLLRNATKNFQGGIQGLNDKFRALQDVMSPVIDLFNTLGMTDLGNFFQIGSNALGAATQASNGLTTLGLGEAGPYGAATAAGLSIFNSVLSMHDTALQEEIDASKQRQKEMENLTKALDKALERTLGGVYNLTASLADRRRLQEYATKYNMAQAARKNKENGKGSYVTNWAADAYGYIGDDTKNAIDKALRTETYFDTKLAELYVQRDELKKQLAAEESKKDSDSGAIEDMKQQIAEMEDEIRNFAIDMAKTLYDIDLKSWASELGDALFEAWKKGEDGAEAFKKKASELIGQVTKKILVTQLIETALMPVKNLISQMMIDTSGKLNAKNFATVLGDALNDSLGKIVPTYNSIMDAVDKALVDSGLTSLKDDDSSSSSSNGIKGVTEQTADLIASYINAIRADVSVNRATLQQILANMIAGNIGGNAPSTNRAPASAASVSEAQQYAYAAGLTENLSTIAQAQLEQLKLIVGNTGRNADLVQEVRDIMHRVTLGGDAIKVK